MASEQIYIIKASGDRELWDKSKLVYSLQSAHADEALTQKITAHIEQDLRDGMRTTDIYNHAFELLKKINRPVAAEYSLRRAILQLGPSGFPFERFIAEILSAEGYSTSTGVIVRGACVEHEVDVVAEKSGERILVEAKYHNSPNTKSDVKVALYVHARFEDIKKQLANSAAGIGVFTKAWLITNTSFTSQAIQYANCSGMALTGWNYPKGHTLQDLVQRTQTHPVTCLTTLTDQHKNELVQSGIVLCKDIVKDQSMLEKMGINRSHIAEIVTEGMSLCPID
jgi:hypothetical protein